MKPASGGRSGSAGRPTSARPASARHASVAAASGKPSTGAANLNGSGNSGVSSASKSGSSASATGTGPAPAASGAAATSSYDGHEYDAVALLDTFVTNDFLADISATLPWSPAQATAATFEQTSAAGTLSCPPSSPPAAASCKGSHGAQRGAQRLVPRLAHVAPTTLIEAVHDMQSPKEHELEAKWISKVQLRWPHGDAGTSPPTTSSETLLVTPTTVDLRQLHLVQFHHGNYQWFLECSFSPDQCNVALAIGHVLYTRLLSTVPSRPTIVDTLQASPPDPKSSVSSVADAAKKPKPAAAAAAAPGTSTPAGYGSKAPSTKNATAPVPTTPTAVLSALISTPPTLPTHPADLARALDDQLGRLAAYHTIVAGSAPEPQRWRVFEPAHADAVVGYYRRTLLSTVRLVQLAHSMVQRAWDEPDDGVDAEEPPLSSKCDTTVVSNVGAMLDQLMIDADAALPVSSVAAV